MLNIENKTDVCNSHQTINLKSSLESNASDISAFMRLKDECLEPIHYDLLSLCLVIEALDREKRRPKNLWTRDFEVTLHVSEISVWTKESVQQCLTDLLVFITGDKWKLNFHRGDNSIQSFQKGLDFQFLGNKNYIIPFSDGLDSYCVSMLFDSDERVLRVRCDKATNLRSFSKLSFDRVKINSAIDKPKESSHYFRGFKFIVITSIISHITKITNIIIPESGQGALGPSLLYQYENYPDFRNHPVFLMKIRHFLKLLINHEVNFIQPRLWSTKGQTVKEFLKIYSTKGDEIISTRSCPQNRWNVRGNGLFLQCGLCPACLLRRMSLNAAGINEPIAKYTFSNLTANQYLDAMSKELKIQITETMFDHAFLGASHLNLLAKFADKKDEELRPHVMRISDACDLPFNTAMENLRELLCNHAYEWQSFVKLQGSRSFLKTWIE